MSPEGAEAKYTGLQATRQSPCIYSCIPCRKELQQLMSLWFEIACQFILIDHKIENMPKHTFHKHFHTNSLSTLQSKCYLDKGSKSTSLSGLAVCLHRLQTTVHLFMLGWAPARRTICFWLSPDCVGPWKEQNQLISLPKAHSPRSMEGQERQWAEGRSYISNLTLLHSFELLELHNHKDGQSYWPSVPSSPEPAQTPHNKSELVHLSTATNRRVSWEFSVQLQERNRLLLASVSSCQELESQVQLQKGTAWVDTCGHLFQTLPPTSFLEIV